MQEILKERIKSFAKLIVKKGVNVQKGQEVVVSAELDQPEFIEYIVKECYEAGARKVRVDWTHQPLEKWRLRIWTRACLERSRHGSMPKWKA